MRPQGHSGFQSATDLDEIFIANHIRLLIAEQTKNARRGDNGDPVLGCETDEYISREQWPRCDYRSIGPPHALGVEGKVMFQGTHFKMLSNSLLMVGENVENLPRTALHLPLLGERMCRGKKEKRINC
jgi:hypothetical protein